MKDTIVDNAQKLPPKIHEALELTRIEKPAGPLLTPLESLKVLLFAEHPAPPPPPVPIVPPPGPDPAPAAEKDAAKRNGPKNKDSQKDGNQKP